MYFDSCNCNEVYCACTLTHVIVMKFIVNDYNGIIKSTSYLKCTLGIMLCGFCGMF